MARAPLTAAAARRSLRAGASRGAGVSSMSFWCRRWIEHSRSKRCTSSPCRSPMTCTSTWRGASRKRSTNSSAVPKADWLRRWARRERRGERGLVAYPRHADAAAPRRGLEQDRVPDASGHLARRLHGLHHALAARDHGHARRRHEPPRGDLVAHVADHGPRRPDPDEPRLLARAREAPVLRQEAVAGMHRLRPRGARGLEEAVHVQIALARRGRPDRHRLVGVPHMGPIAVRFRVHGDGAHAVRAARADDAAGDLPAVGDQDTAEHCRQADESGSRPTASTISARHSPAAGAQRARRVTAPRAPAARTPSRRIFTTRLSPIFAKATT